MKVYNWNPPLSKNLIVRRLPLQPRVNNFGDLIGPMLVELLRKRRGLGKAKRSARLLSVGSVLHNARNGDVVWGSGVNGKMPIDAHRFVALDVRAVRGPLTRSFLESRDIAVPEIYGDPALLLPYFHPQIKRWSGEKRHEITVVPNLNDWREYRDLPNVLNPRSPLEDCLRRLAQSEFVVGSSLHGIIVAEALGIPAKAIVSKTEATFKYADYYTGTGRSDYSLSGSLDEAIRTGGEKPLDWSMGPLLAAFPYDLWDSPE